MVIVEREADKRSTRSNLSSTTSSANAVGDTKGKQEQLSFIDSLAVDLFGGKKSKSKKSPKEGGVSSMTAAVLDDSSAAAAAAVVINKDDATATTVNKEMVAVATVSIESGNFEDAADGLMDELQKIKERNTFHARDMKDINDPNELHKLLDVVMQENEELWHISHRAVDAVKQTNMRITAIEKEIIVCKDKNGEIEKIKKEMHLLMEDKHKREIRDADCCILIKNIQMTRGESSEQTWDIVTGIINDIGAQVEPTHVKRLLPPKTKAAELSRAGKSSAPFIKVWFQSPWEKREIFKQVPNWAKARPNNKVQFERCFPPFLLPSLKELEHKAFNLRRTDGCRTRIDIRGTELVLMKKMRDSNQYQLHPL